MSPDLIAWGAVYKPATTKPGEQYWRLVVADGPMDIGGNHHVYVDVWDEAGLRIVGVPVMFYWRDTEEHDDRRPTEAKTGEPYSVNLPMYAGGHSYGVRVDDGLPSDDIFGFGMADHGPHQSFRAIFQRQIAAGGNTEPHVPPVPSEPPTPPIPPPNDYLRVALIRAREAIDAALTAMGAK